MNFAAINFHLDRGLSMAFDYQRASRDLSCSIFNISPVGGIVSNDGWAGWVVWCVLGIEYKVVPPSYKWVIIPLYNYRYITHKR